MGKAKKQVTRIESPYMNEYEVKQKRKRRHRRGLRNRLLVFGLVSLLLFTVMATYHVKQRTIQSDLEQQYEELAAEYDGLESQSENLNEEINLLNDEEYILDIARSHYFLSKKGELIFQVDNQGERSY